MNFTKQLIAIGVLVALSLATLRAQDTLYWTGDTDTLWSKNTNWSATPGGSAAVSAPSSSTVVIFTTGATNNCAADVAVSVAELLILDNTTADLYLYGNSLAVSGNFTQHAGVFQGSTANIAIGGLLHLIGGEFHATTGTTSIADGIIEEGPYFSPHGGKVSITGTGATLDMAGFFYDLQIATGASAELANGIQIAHNLDLDGPINADVNVIVLGNDAPGAITGSSGVYFSIGAGPIGLFIWLIGENTGTYTLPFLATTSGPVIPVEVGITTAGDGPDGALLFSCIELDDAKPQDLLGDGVGYYNATGGNNADYNLNRMWLTVASDYTVSPIFDLELSYTTADLSGISATEANLKAQAYNEQHWGELLGTVNTTANTLALTGHALPTDGRANFLTLVDNTSPNKITYGGKTGLTCADAIEISDAEPDIEIRMESEELWFKFTATDVVTTISAYKYEGYECFMEDMELYSGNCAGGLSLVGDTIVSPDSFLLELRATSLTVDDDYYAKIIQPAGVVTFIWGPIISGGAISLTPPAPNIEGTDIVCEGAYVTYCITNESAYASYGRRPSYRWAISGGSIISQSGNCVTVSWYSTGSVGTLSATTYLSGFLPSATTVFTKKACCIGVSDGPVVANVTVSSFSTTYNSGASVYTTTDQVVFNGTLTIDVNFTFDNCPNIKFGPDAKVVIQSGKTLTITESVLKAGCNEMWAGIEIPATGNLVVSASEIWDAKIAVKSLGGGDFTLDGSELINNRVSVHLESYNGTHTGEIVGTTIDATGPLLAPFSGQFGTYGLIANDVSLLFIGNSSLAQNEFLGMEKAVYLTNTSAAINNNKIYNLQGTLSDRAGIIAINPVTNTINYEILINGNTIEDCYDCVKLTRYKDITITSNTITPLDNTGIGINITSNEVVSTNCDGEININNNYIYNSLTGIVCFNYACLNHRIFDNDIINEDATIVNYTTGIAVFNRFNFMPLVDANLETFINHNDVHHTHLGVVASTRHYAVISDNWIEVMWNFAGDRKFGTYINSSLFANIDCNRISGVANASITGQSIAARAQEIFGNYQVNSWVTAVANNRVLGTGWACSMDGANYFSSVTENDWFTDNFNSFSLFNQGIVLEQGSQTIPTLNRLSRSFTLFSLQSHFHSGESEGSLSKFWLRGDNNDDYHPDPLERTSFGANATILSIGIGVDTGPTIDLCSNYYLPVDGFNDEAAKDVILDSLDFGDDSITYKWWAKWATYNALSVLDSIAYSDSVYIDFMADYGSSAFMVELEGLKTVVWEYNVDEAIPADYEELLQDLNNLSPSNVMEENALAMAKYVLKWKAGTYNNYDEAAIWDIANLCAFYGGPSVHEARNFLSADSFDLWHKDWEDSCIVPSPKRGADEINNVVETNRKIYDLYPNPAKGKLNIDWRNGEDATVQFFNIIGQKVSESKLSDGTNTIVLSNDKFVNGLYIIRFVQGGVVVANEKLVVQP